MSKKVLSAQDKISAVMKYREGNISQRKLAEQLNVSLATMQQWIRNYESMGKDAFLMKNYKSYSKELKLQAVQDYLNGQGSLNDICKKYGIRATSKLGKWIKQYNSDEELKASRTGGTVIMTRGRKTTFDERVEIASYCISHNYNYAEAAEKFSVSYQQARNYTVKYENKGVDALQDNRGKRKSEDTLTEIERLRAELRLEKAMRQKAEMEASFLKKLDEIERRRG